MSTSVVENRPEERRSAACTDQQLDFIAICYEFPPWIFAGAIWTAKLLAGLRDQGWKVEVITGAPGGAMEGVPVHHVPNPGLPGWLNLMRRWKLNKITDFMGRSEERRVGKEGRFRWSPYH